MEFIRLGSSGDDVVRWQCFLRGFYPDCGKVLICDGAFGPITEATTKRFQAQFGLSADGIVGNETVGKAMQNGLAIVHDSNADPAGPCWPAAPVGIAPIADGEKSHLFGAFEFEPAPTPTNPEAIKILGSWQKDNIITVNVPQFSRVPSSPKSGTAQVHRLIAQQFLGLWSVWDREGLLDRVRTFNGAYVPRFIRGSRTMLSQHSYGTAFDINAIWNRLGSQGALVGEEGCVRELVAAAVEHGFYWGGWFKRIDCNHFEVFKVLDR